MFGLFKHSLGPAGRLTVPAVFGSNFAWDGDGVGDAAPPPSHETNAPAPEIVLRVTAPSAPSFWMLIYGADLERITGRGTVDAEAISEQEARFVIRPTATRVSLAHVLDESRYVPERIATGSEGAVEVTLAPIAPDGQPMTGVAPGPTRFESPVAVPEPSHAGSSLWLVRDDDEPEAEAASEADEPWATVVDETAAVLEGTQEWVAPVAVDEPWAATHDEPAAMLEDTQEWVAPVAVDEPWAATNDEPAAVLEEAREPVAPVVVDEPHAESASEQPVDPWFLLAERPTASDEQAVAEDAPAAPADTSLLHPGVLGDAVGSVDWLALLRRDPAAEPQQEPTAAPEQRADPWFDWVPAAPSDTAEGPATSDTPDAENAVVAFEPAVAADPWTFEAPIDDAATQEQLTDAQPALAWQPAVDATSEPVAPEAAADALDAPVFDWPASEAETEVVPAGTEVEPQPASLFDAPLMALPETETDDDASEAPASDSTPAPLAWPPVNVVTPDETDQDEDATVRGSAAPSPRPIAHSPVVLVQDLYRRPTRETEVEAPEDDAAQADEPAVEDDPQLIELAQRKPRVRGVNTYFESLGTSPAPEPQASDEPVEAPARKEKERKPKFKLLSLFKKKAAALEPAAPMVDEEIDFERFKDLDPFWRRLAVLSVELGLGSSEGASGGLARAVESGVQDIHSLVVAGGITEEQFTDLAALALGVPRLRVTATTPVADSPVGPAVPVGRVGHTLFVATSSLEPAEAIAPFERRAPQTQALLVSRGELDHLSRGALRSISPRDDDAPPRLGEVLVTFGHITNTQLDRALQRQEREQGSVGYLLRLSGEIDETAFIEALALQLGLPWMRIEQVRPYAEAVSLIPTEVAERYGVLGVARTTEGLYVGFIDALDEEARDAVRTAVNLPVLPVVVGRDGLARTFGRVFAA